MDRRRFFINKTLNEGLVTDKKRYLLEDVFNELSRLCEANEEADEVTDETAPETTQNDTANNKDAGSLDDIQKEIKNVEVPAANIKLEGKAEDLYNDLIDILQKSNLASAVEILEIVSKDPKLSLLLRHGFTNGSNEKEVLKVSITPTEVPVAKMFPTQKEIGTDGSLKNILTGTHPKGSVDYTDYFAGGVVKSMPGPFVYQDGDKYYIIDGHHRWSQTYCLNPQASLKCNVLVANTSLSPEEVLKNFQAAIAVDPARQGLGTKGFEGENFFEFAKSADSVISYFKGMSDEVAEKIASSATTALSKPVTNAVKTYGAQVKTALKTDNKNKIIAISWVTKNAVALATVASNEAKNNPTRKLMPQSDDNTFDIVKDAMAIGKDA